MMQNNIRIATMTFDKKGDRDLTLEALAVLSRKGHQAYIADGGSSEKFVRSLEQMGHQIEIISGLTFQHKNAILRASNNAPNILYTEPDKLAFFNQGLDESIEKYLNSEFGFAVVSRTQEIMATFPKDQQRTENFANNYISRTVFGKTGGDFIYGPKLFISDLGKTLQHIHQDIGWGCLMFLVGRASKLKLNIGELPYAAECPQSQRGEGEEHYRVKQMVDNLIGFQLGLQEDN